MRIQSMTKSWMKKPHASSKSASQFLQSVLCCQRGFCSSQFSLATLRISFAVFWWCLRAYFTAEGSGEGHLQEGSKKSRWQLGLYKALCFFKVSHLWGTYKKGQCFHWALLAIILTFLIQTMDAFEVEVLLLLFSVTRLSITFFEDLPFPTCKSSVGRVLVTSQSIHENLTKIVSFFKRNFTNIFSWLTTDRKKIYRGIFLHSIKTKSLKLQHTDSILTSLTEVYLLHKNQTTIQI